MNLKSVQHLFDFSALTQHNINAPSTKTNSSYFCYQIELIDSNFWYYFLDKTVVLSSPASVALVLYRALISRVTAMKFSMIMISMMK